MFRAILRLLRLSPCRACGHYFDTHYDSEDDMALPAACAVCEDAACATHAVYEDRHVAMEAARHRYVAS